MFKSCFVCSIQNWNLSPHALGEKKQLGCILTISACLKSQKYLGAFQPLVYLQCFQDVLFFLKVQNDQYK